MYDNVRSAHLERAHQLAPASILYRRQRYDFDPSLAEGLDLHQGGLIVSAITILRSDLSMVEVNEPLMRQSVARTAALVAVARGAARLRGRELRLTAYAIENRDPFGQVGRAAVRARARAVLDRAAGRYVARRLDRVAFGTAAAERLYDSVLGEELSRARRTVVPALSAPCGCVADGGPGEGRVLFLGALTDRKGVPLLLEAWPEVVARRPDARLTVVGSGPLQPAVVDLASREPSVQLLVGPPRAQVHALLRASSLLVLLSQRTPTWREQVGLPIVEALAHGCPVVTTTETGMARWLTDHGHDVLAPDAPASEVAAVVVAALDRRRPPESVLADLPRTDGRLDADAWLSASG
ncbi:Glycosyl transferases group 1 [Blastococcus sp. DSM 46786]|uniref:glycosyltransferase family 4 protein n=1 Tax=Blastococcus sp. DSM 46786 TaxID=1798227 RepID=UPI0008D12464|nr:glycosyltransferase family 4 protein [Blastococcus sp. DSM 46786]SEL20423.1 Glycosyl transferases group 1 [Blastococcus sp. DSM 46786]